MGEAARRKLLDAPSTHDMQRLKHRDRFLERLAAKCVVLASGKRSTYVTPERMAELVEHEAEIVKAKQRAV